jgi:hypothetical protein
MKKHITLLFLTLVLLVLAACSGQLPQQMGFSDENRPLFATPTTHDLFDTRAKTVVAGQAGFSAAVSEPTVSSHFQAYQPEKKPTSTPHPTPTFAEVKVTQLPVQQVTIYSDWIKPGWQIFSPDEAVKIDTRARGSVIQGSYAIAVTPSRNGGSVYIVSGPSNGDFYLRRSVYGFSLQLFSGSQGLELNDLAFSAIGSDGYSYYREDDLTVLSRADYEETTLNYLGFNNSIPPRTWVEVVIWLDEMLYDPDYHFVTGLYITPRKGMSHTFVIDDINLLVR